MPSTPLTVPVPLPVYQKVKNCDSIPLQLVFQEGEVIKMDGFVIELDVDADEQLMVSREEPYKPPDYRYYQSSTFENHLLHILPYSGGARCIICMSAFAETTEAVSHIHETHNIQVKPPSPSFSWLQVHLSPDFQVHLFS